jgi:hypothetical protein
MQDEVYLPRHVDEIGDVAAQAAKAWSPEQMSDVGRCTGEEVVQADDLGTELGQRFTQVASEEPSTSGDNDPPCAECHPRPPCPAMRKAPGSDRSSAGTSCAAEGQPVPITWRSMSWVQTSSI